MQNSSDYHLVIVPHTHWDREWYQSHEIFRYRLVRMIDRVLHLLEADATFAYFTLDGQSIVLTDYLEVRPEARERLAKLIRAGRLLVGPWYVSPDEWLVSGEALIRNLRLGLASGDEMGGAMRLGYVPDQFGHVGQLPQLFSGFGFDAAILWRGVDLDETLFEWESPDGTRIFTVFLIRGYGNASHLPCTGSASDTATRLRDEARRLGRCSRIRTLLLMNGTDHSEPDPALPVVLASSAGRLQGLSYEIGTLTIFVRHARDEARGTLPVRLGELRSSTHCPMLVGCSSVRMSTKQANFENDRMLTQYLEPLAAWLNTFGEQVDLKLIQFAWRLLLENHAHDSICGCCLDRVNDDIQTRFRRVRDLSSAHFQEVFARIAMSITVPDCTTDPFLVVWTPHGDGPAPITATVEVTGQLRLAVLDSSKRRLPANVRLIEPERDLVRRRLPIAEAIRWLDRRTTDLLGFFIQDLSWRSIDQGLELLVYCGRQDRSDADLGRKRQLLQSLLQAGELSFVELAVRRRALLEVRFVASLQANSLRLFHLKPEDAAGDISAALRQEHLPNGGLAIENDFWRVEVDVMGRVKWRWTQDGIERCCDDAIRIVSEADRGDTYNFDAIEGAEIVDRPERVRLHAHELGTGSACVTLSIEASYRIPCGLSSDRTRRSKRKVSVPVTVGLQLWAGVDQVNVTVDVDNRARDHHLRLLLRTQMFADRFFVESAFETVERPLGLDPKDLKRLSPERPDGVVPQRTFATLDDGEVAITVANRGNTAVEAVRENDGTTSFALTLVRSVGWLSRDDLRCRDGNAGPPLETPDAQMQGLHRAEFSLSVHKPGTIASIHQAHGFAYPPVAIQRSLDDRQGGLIADGDRLIRIDDPNVLISAIEPLVGGIALVRAFNCSDKARRVAIYWRGKVPVHFESVNLAGSPIPATFEHSEKNLFVKLRGWEIASWRLG